jgi:hypothetical protein
MASRVLKIVVLGEIAVWGCDRWAACPLRGRGGFGCVAQAVVVSRSAMRMML